MKKINRNLNLAARNHKIFVFSLLLLIFLLECGSKGKEDVSKIVIGYKSDPLTLDPHLASEVLTISVQSNIFEGLVSFDRDMRIQPALAKSWENPDDLTWIFHLRQGVKFHDGSLLKASDVKFSLERAKTLPASAMKGNFVTVETIKAIDDWTIEIKTKGPCGLLLKLLIGVYIIPEGYAKERGDEYLKEYPVGTGPYRFVEWMKNDYLCLKANEDYWGGISKVKEVIFKPIYDRKTAVDFFLQGKADIMNEIPPEEIGRVESQPNVYLLKKPGLIVRYLGMNLRKKPFSDLRVRQAINLGIGKERIVKEILRERAYLATQFVSPNVFGYNPEIEEVKYNPEKAKKLLQEAGYAKGFEISFDVPSVREKLANEIAKDLAIIGIKVKLNLLSVDEFLKRVESKESQFFLLGSATVFGDASDFFDDAIHSFSSQRGYGIRNYGGYFNKKLDELIEESATLINETKRLKMLHQAMKMTVDELPRIPLYVEEDIYGVSKRIVWLPRNDLTIQAKEISLAKKD
ncbi:MAG: ABC transporter substrate-binding protein [Candidatus Edwardsbacteria bacterium]